MDKEKRSKKRIVIILLVILVAVLVAICSRFKIHVVLSEKGQSSDDYTFALEFKGSERFTDAELKEYFFPDNATKNPFVFYGKSMFTEEIAIPFIETYDLEMTSLGKFTITLYDKSVVGYIKYMSNNVYFDKDGIVVESSIKELEEVPLVTGLDFDYIILHEELPAEDKDIFSLLLDVTQLCEKYSLEVKKINCTADMEIQIYIDDIRVDLGDGNMLNEKILDLNDMYEQLKGESGILNMKEYDAEDKGYILKKK